MELSILTQTVRTERLPKQGHEHSQKHGAQAAPSSVPLHRGREPQRYERSRSRSVPLLVRDFVDFLFFVQESPSSDLPCRPKAPGSLDSAPRGREKTSWRWYTVCGGKVGRIKASLSPVLFVVEGFFRDTIIQLGTF